MAGLGRPIELAAVVYAHQLDPAIAPLLAPMDTVLFWTWHHRNSKAWKGISGGLNKSCLARKCCWAATCGTSSAPPGPMPVPLLKRQCDFGLRWLKRRHRRHDFLATNILRPWPRGGRVDAPLDRGAWRRTAQAMTFKRIIHDGSVSIAIACLSGGATGLAAALYPPTRPPLQNLVVEGRSVATIVLADPASAVERQPPLSWPNSSKPSAGPCWQSRTSRLQLVCLHLGASAERGWDWPNSGQAWAPMALSSGRCPRGWPLPATADLGRCMGFTRFSRKGWACAGSCAGNHGTVAPPRRTVQIAEA